MQCRLQIQVARRNFCRPLLGDRRAVKLLLTQRPKLQCLFSPNASQRRRDFSLASIPTVLLPPVVFGGLLITLWTYKCLMMIIFQNKIIYMPSMPPFSRSEKVEDYVDECKPIKWTEHQIKSLDGTKLMLLQSDSAVETQTTNNKRVIVVYFQGNASSLPPRLPFLSNILKQLQQVTVDTIYTLVALSYRGYWKSSGSANQKGIELDAQAALQWVSKQFPDATVVVWGQSIGAGVATNSTASRMSNGGDGRSSLQLPVSGLLLETPFTSLRAMLIALYPQKFLPYRYLGPFLLSTWDSEAAFRHIVTVLESGKVGDTGPDHEKLRVLLLEAGDDELVPKGDAERLLQICQTSTHIGVEHKVISGALHTNVMMKGQGKKEIVRFLRNFESKTTP